MLNEAVSVNRGLETDNCDLDSILLGAPSRDDSTSSLDFAWPSLTKDVQLNDASEEECIAATDVGPYASTTYDVFGGEFGLQDNLAGPPLFAPRQATKPSFDELDPLLFISKDQDLDGDTLPNCDEAHNTTSGELSPTSTRSPASTASTASYRERNRVAARKCRQKAKQNVAGLERRETELSQQNKMLLRHVSSLREEVLDLKTEILRHSDCNSATIEKYIANSARRQLE